MYKTSLYNLFVPYKDKIVYANLLQETSFLLSPAEDERIQQQLNDPISFELGYPSVFARFKDWGFIVDDRIDEFALFRQRVIKRFYQNRNCHLVIHTGEESDMQLPRPVLRVQPTANKETGWLDGLKKHITCLVKQEKIESLCLEFTGGEPFLQFHSLIEPLCRYARQQCKDIPFSAQVETNGLAFLSCCRLFGPLGIGSIKLTLEANERRHDKIRHEKGVPTFRRICANIVTACKSVPTLHCLVQFDYDSTDDPKELQRVLDSFPASIRNQITLSFNRTNQTNAIEQVLRQNNDFETRLQKTGFQAMDPLQTDSGWRFPIDEHRYVRTVFPDGNCYFGKQELLIPVPGFGKLDIKTGEITGDELQEYRAANLQWYDNPTCRACKLLPAVHPICAKTCRQIDSLLIPSVCPLHRKTFCEEDVVVLLFEQKKEWIRQFIAK